MLKLFMILLGGYPKGRLIEQHDIFFGIGTSMKELVDEMIASWTETNGDMHVDAWREVTYVDGNSVIVFPKNDKEVGEISATIQQQLYFLNLGGYKPNEFEEYHYKMIVAANNKAEAIQQARKTTFFKHTGFKGAAAHIDDKYGIDVDDVFKIEDVLSDYYKEKYCIHLSPNANGVEDELKIGYFKLSKL